jgi:methylphosphotriester-DNA--protein-cysteine methyltransferase
MRPLADREAAHGLEQQLIHALVESLSAEPGDGETGARRDRVILARFEDLIKAEPVPSITEIGAGLGISRQLLRACCKKSLGMGPSRYRRLRIMQLVFRALRTENSNVGVAEVAARYGVRDLRRFASD